MSNLRSLRDPVLGSVEGRMGEGEAGTWEREGKRDGTGWVGYRWKLYSSG